MTDIDLKPLKLRGPIGGSNRQRYANFARMFTYQGALYVAESPDRGRTVSQVTMHDIPSTPPSRPGRQATWGEWQYSSCGCANYWSSHSVQSLATKAVDVRVVDLEE